MTDTTNQSTSEQSELTPCPPTSDSAELQNQEKWESYDNRWGNYLFHGGMEGYLEKTDPSPENPQQECFYDESGALIDKDHEYAGMGGSANEYDGHGDSFSDLGNHTFYDKGGIWEKGGEGVATSLEHYYDTAADSVEHYYDVVKGSLESYFDRPEVAETTERTSSIPFLYSDPETSKQVESSFQEKESEASSPLY